MDVMAEVIKSENEGRDHRSHTLTVLEHVAVIASSQEEAFWRELQYAWPYRFGHNCLGYFIILVPGALFVYLVKSGKLNKYSCECIFRFLVYFHLYLFILSIPSPTSTTFCVWP